MDTRYYFAAWKNGRAEMLTVPAGESPNSFWQDRVADGYSFLDEYTVETEAQERCTIQNDPTKYELFMMGKLKVPKTGGRSS